MPQALDKAPNSVDSIINWNLHRSAIVMIYFASRYHCLGSPSFP